MAVLCPHIHRIAMYDKTYTFEFSHHRLMVYAHELGEEGMPRVQLIADARTPYALEDVPALVLHNYDIGKLLITHPRYAPHSFIWDRAHHVVRFAETSELDRFVYQGNLPRDAAEQRLLDEYMQAISARVNDELDRRLTNLLAFGTTHPETTASIATSEEEQGLTWERVRHMHDEVQARHEDNAPPVTAGEILARHAQLRGLDLTPGGINMVPLPSGVRRRVGMFFPEWPGTPTPEVDYTEELADVPTIDEMWAKMEKLGILRDV